MASASGSRDAAADALLGALLEDPVVRQRLEQDPDLRRMWTGLSAGAATPTDDGVRKLMQLAQALLAQPEVLEQVQTDPALRAMWSDPAVRETIREEARE